MQSVALSKQSRRDEAIKRGQEKEKAQLARDVKTVFGSPAGKRVFWHLLDHCRVFNDVFETSSRVYYMLGKQSVGKHLLDLMDMNTLRGLNEMRIEFLERELGALKAAQGTVTTSE